MSITIVVLALVVAFGLGWSASWVLERFPSRPQLPPASKRALHRAARANRLDVRGPERWVSPANADFDDEETR